MIIGLVGLAQSGKDSTADVLVKKFGFKKVSFAGPLKQIAYDIDPLIEKDVHLAEMVDLHGWDYVKVNFPECRRFLQRIGTEGMRKNIDDNFWVNLALAKMKKKPHLNYVISDMRFVNEFNQMKKAYGDDFVAWRISRNGLPMMNHSSETEMAKIPTSITVDNNGTLDALEKEVSSLAQSLDIHV